MEEKLEYNFLHKIFSDLNFITVSYYVSLKIVAFFVIPSDQKRRRKTICQGGGG